ncbi:MAG: AAA family ATPase [Desulfobacteraceae bacterium]|nr:AAA family ATPase [Desulfobacteraceae bacterium]
MRNQILEYFKGNFEPFYRKYLPNIQKIGGDEWRAKCPFHEDRDPSFNFSAITGQYFCHGCQKKGDVFHFYGKVNGLNTGADFGKILRGIAGDFGISITEEKGRITATYDYLTAEGKPLFQVCRIEPGKNGKAKDFRQRRPDGKGGWIWSLKDIEPVLYRLSEVLKADEILLVEGEKDVENVRRLGLLATTCPMGAGKWRESYTEALKGKRVILCPDNDAPGREHMAKVAQSLNGHAASIKLLTLPNLPSKGDISDFIATFKDPTDAAERLAILMDGAPPYEPSKKATIEDAVMDIRDFRRLEVATRKNYLAPWCKEDAIILASGWRGVGKTFFALGVLDAITSGGTFGPWKCEASAPCLYLDGEMPAADTIGRSDLLGLNTGRKSPLLVYCDAYANHIGLPRANLNSDNWRQSIKRILTTRHIKLWVIDNLASVAGGLDENSRQDWDPINQWLLELRFAGISTIMLHHVGKGGAQRGTSAREDNLDCSLILKSPPDYTPEDGARFICHFSKARVGASDLQLIQDMEFRLSMDQSGRHVWTWGGVKTEMRKQVLTMLDEGTKQIDVASSLGLTRGQVSKIRAAAIKAGHLTESNKLTQSYFTAAVCDAD